MKCLDGDEVVLVVKMIAPPGIQEIYFLSRKCNHENQDIGEEYHIAGYYLCHDNSLYKLNAIKYAPLSKLHLNIPFKWVIMGDDDSCNASHT